MNGKTKEYLDILVELMQDCYTNGVNFPELYEEAQGSFWGELNEQEYAEK